MSDGAGLMQEVRLGDWLRLSAGNYPDRDCFVTAERRWTFAEVNSRVNRLADALADHGIAHGDRVALFATDSFRYAETLLACCKLGATYVPLNFRLAEPELRHLLEVARPDCLFLSSRYREMVGGVRPGVPSIRLAVCYEGGGTDDVGYEDLLASGRDVEADVPVRDDDLLGIAFTSGTTGLPKGVMHSQRTTKHLTYQTIFERRLPAVAFHYSPAPLFHVAGMLYVYSGVARGHTSLLLDQFDPASVLWWLQEGELTGCFLVPTMISSVLQQPGVDDRDYPHLRSIAYGAAPMPPPLLRRAMDVFDCDFLNMFGAGTEAGLQTLLTPDDHRRALAGDEYLLGSIGKPAMGVDVRIVDEDFKEVPPGIVGEIVSRADAAMSGYLDLPDETATAFHDGWFRGGDMAYRDAEGYLYLSGRRDDMIIRGGENVYPVEIESVLAELPGLAEVAVIGVPDAHWGEIVRACVVMVEGTVFDEAVARDLCRSRLAKYKVPEQFRVEPALPKNAGGKVLKRELRRLAAAEPSG